jgi:hypothetical protein
MDKKTLIEAVRNSRVAWDVLLAQVGEERKTTPGVTGNWSVKDVVAHLTAWERRPVAWLTAVRQSATPEPAPWPPNLSEEQTNAWIYEANRGRSLREILDESGQVHEQCMKQLLVISEEELNVSGRYSWLNGSTLAESILGNTYEHYQEHSQMLRMWLESEEVQ